MAASFGSTGLFCDLLNSCFYEAYRRLFSQKQETENPINMTVLGKVMNNEGPLINKHCSLKKVCLQSTLGGWTQKVKAVFPM
jgi:hypothetical protein